MELRYMCLNSIHVVQHRVQQWALVNTVMNCGVP
jgi:hypothetical protein